MTRSSGSVRVAGAALLLVFLGCAVFVPRLGGDFVADTFQFLAAIEFLGQQGRTVQEAFASEAYGSTLLPFYRPLGLLSLALDYHTIGLEPFAFRLVDVMLHLWTAGLVGLIAWRVTGAGLTSIAAASLFAVWPASAEAVYWESSRGLLLANLFGTAALLGVVRAAQARRAPGATGRGRLATVAAAASLTLALLGYETAVAFVPLLTIATFVLQAEHGARGAARALARTAWAWVLLALYLGWRRVLLGKWVGGYGLGGVQPLSLAFWRERLEHVVTAMSPVHLDVFPLVVKVLFGAAASIAVLLGLLAARRAPAPRPLVGIGVAWAVCLAFPTLFLAVGARHLGNGRLLYAQSAGIAVLVACGIGALAPRPRLAHGVLVAAIASAAVVLSGNLIPWREAGEMAGKLRAHIAAAAAPTPDTEMIIADLPFARRGAFVATGAITMPPFAPPGRSAPILVYLDCEPDLMLHALAQGGQQRRVLWRFDPVQDALVPQTLMLPRPQPLGAGGAILAARSRNLPTGWLAVAALVGPGTPPAIGLRVTAADGTVLAVSELVPGTSFVGDVRHANLPPLPAGGIGAFVELADGARWLRLEAIGR